MGVCPEKDLIPQKGPRTPRRTSYRERLYMPWGSLILHLHQDRVGQLLRLTELWELEWMWGEAANPMKSAPGQGGL